MLPWGRVTVIWTKPTAVPNVATDNCLLLHQYNELFFRDIWLPCLRWGKGWIANKVGKCCSSAHFVSKYCYYLLLLLPHFFAWLIHTASYSLPNISMHNLLLCSSCLHWNVGCRVHPRLFSGFHNICWALSSNTSPQLTGRTGTGQGRVTLATISCIVTQDQRLSRRTETLFSLNGLWKHFH